MTTEIEILDLCRSRGLVPVRLQPREETFCGKVLIQNVAPGLDGQRATEREIYAHKWPADWCIFADCTDEIARLIFGPIKGPLHVLDLPPLLTDTASTRASRFETWQRAYRATLEAPRPRT